MKIVIKQKRYDTDTAVKCASWETDCAPSDLQWYREVLYRKKTGEFFLHGEGHANSKYAKSCGDYKWVGTEKIIPLTYGAAQQWAKGHLSAIEYDRIFGAVKQNKSRVIVTFSLPKETSDKLKRISSQTRKTQSDIVTALIDNAK